MEHLIFICPSTGRQVDSGVESEIGTLLRIRQQNLRVLCPACGEWHQWAVRDAFLAKAASNVNVWTAPSWQELSSRLQHWSVQPCVRPLDAVHMTAGHNALRGSGPGH